MLRTTGFFAALLLATAPMTARADYYCYPAAPAPAVSYYYAPPTVSYYAPAVSYYAPAPAVSYYAAPAVSYYAAPAVSYYAAPAVSYYSAPVTTYYTGPTVTTYRYGLFGRRSTTVVYP